MNPALDALRRAEDALAELRAILAAEPATAAPAPPSKLLGAEDISHAADVLGVTIPQVRAVIAVESGKLGGFGTDGRPIILYEPHIFSRLTQHRYDDTHGGVSYLRWKAKPYPASQADRWAQLEYAANLDRPAAIQSASYGLFQIMGFNFKVCGFTDPEAFFAAMHVSEREHLMAFVGFVKGNSLDRHLIAGDWEAFARGYNGPGQAPAYAAKLAAAHAKWSQA